MYAELEEISQNKFFKKIHVHLPGKIITLYVLWRKYKLCIVTSGSVQKNKMKIINGKSNILLTICNLSIPKKIYFRKYIISEFLFDILNDGGGIMTSYTINP